MQDGALQGLENGEGASQRPARKKAAAYKNVDRVEVFLWDQLMGAVALNPAYGYHAFAYAPAFLASGIQPAPLQMPLNSGDAYLFTDLPTET